MNVKYFLAQSNQIGSNVYDDLTRCIFLDASLLSLHSKCIPLSSTLSSFVIYAPYAGNSLKYKQNINNIKHKQLPIELFLGVAQVFGIH